MMVRVMVSMASVGGVGFGFGGHDLCGDDVLDFGLGGYGGLQLLEPGGDVGNLLP